MGTTSLSHPHLPTNRQGSQCEGETAVPYFIALFLWVTSLQDKFSNLLDRALSQQLCSCLKQKLNCIVIPLRLKKGWVRDLVTSNGASLA